MPPANRHEPRRAKSSTSDYSVTEFLAEFPDDAACLEHLWRTRHAPDGEHAHCPKCDARRSSSATRRSSSASRGPAPAAATILHPTAGTIFHRSSTSLRLWYHAMYLMTSTRCGISAKQLERELGVHYKTAWRMFNEIRNELMAEATLPARGEVEVDETSWGGTRAENSRPARNGALPQAKPTVLGMIERGGGPPASHRVARGEPLSEPSG